MPRRWLRLQSLGRSARRSFGSTSRIASFQAIGEALGDALASRIQPGFPSFCGPERGLDAHTALFTVRQTGRCFAVLLKVTASGATFSVSMLLEIRLTDAEAPRHRRRWHSGRVSSAWLLECNFGYCTGVCAPRGARHTLQRLGPPLIRGRSSLKRTAGGELTLGIGEEVAIGATVVPKKGTGDHPHTHIAFGLSVRPLAREAVENLFAERIQVMRERPPSGALPSGASIFSTTGCVEHGG